MALTPRATRALTLALITGLSLALVLVLTLGRPSEPAPPTPSVPGRALPRIAHDDATIGRPTLTEAAPPDAEAVDPVRITHDPEVLQVYRSTRVSLAVTLPADHRNATCRWSFASNEEDGAPADTRLSPCAVEHTFIGGAANERVSVEIVDGTWTKSLTQIIPLERLPVTTRPVEPEAAGNVPAKPSSPNSFRMVIIADTSGADAALLGALARRIVAIDTDVVVHLGGHAADGEEWNRLRETLVEGLRAADIPLLSAVSPADLTLGPEVRRPLGKGGEQLDLTDGAHFPERWSFSYEGVFMAFMSGADQTSDQLDWLRDRLAEAQVYESRIVFSYLPLLPFGEHIPEGTGSHTLGPKFKVYEILQRARTTALLTAGHFVYFKGRYGALSVVSVGSAAKGGQRLLGNDLAQPPSITVMDVERGLPQRVFALTSAPATDGAVPFDTILDEAYLPKTVDVYTQ